MRFFGHHGCLADERGAGVHLDVDVEVRTDTRGPRAPTGSRTPSTTRGWSRGAGGWSRTTATTWWRRWRSGWPRSCSRSPGASSVRVRVAKRPPLAGGGRPLQRHRGAAALVTATIIDGSAIAKAIRAEIAAEVTAMVAEGQAVAPPRGGALWRRPRQRDLRPQQGPGRRAGRHPLQPAHPGRRQHHLGHPRPLRADARRPRHRRDAGPAPAAAPDRLRCGPRGGARRQGRRRVPSPQPRPARRRGACPGAARDPARLPGAAPAVRACPSPGAARWWSAGA